VAWAGSVTGVAEHDSLRRRSPDLTAFTGGGVGGFLRLSGRVSARGVHRSKERCGIDDLLFGGLCTLVMPTELIPKKLRIGILL